MQELGSFFILLVVAGNETTETPSRRPAPVHREPEPAGRLLEDLDGRLPGAVDEIVRLASPVD